MIQPKEKAHAESAAEEVSKHFEEEKLCKLRTGPPRTRRGVARHA